MIDLALLGTGSLMPTRDRWLSSLLARVEGELTLFDCGEGTQVAWHGVGWNARRLSAICFSHLHADHVAGLPGMLYAIAHTGREESVVIHGPRGTVRVVAGLRTIAPDLPYPVVVLEHEPGDRFALPGGLEARVGAGSHSTPCLAYRVELRRQPRFLAKRAMALKIPMDQWSRLQAGEPVQWDGGSAIPNDVLGPPRPGVVFGFVTDTRLTRSLSSLVANVDLLVCEGTYGDTANQERAMQRGHMTFADAATLAESAEVGEMWLTHFNPAMTEPEEFLINATSIFPATTIGRDGMTTRLVFRPIREEVS